MTLRGFDPFRLDVAAFAKDAGELDGRWPLASLVRLAGSAAAESPPADADQVTWRARGERRSLRGGESQTWMHVEAAARLGLECQRCLSPVETDLAVERRFRFVHGEDTAAQLDADSEDDVLALTRSLDLRELIEDELLLTLPLVPRHAVCPEPLTLERLAEPDAAAPHPFAGLGNLKPGGAAN